MSEQHFKAMQMAVDVVNDSPHPTHKISSAVFNDDFIVTATNYWPDAIDRHIGQDKRIGNSSGTVHAETAAILKAPKTDGASICITDPFCPNCAKNIAESGIKTVYIDHKGFKKTFWKKSGDHFENMSMEIVAKAGVSVYKIHRKEQKITPIYEAPKGFIPPDDSPIQIEPCPHDAAAFKALVHDMSQQHYNRKFVTAMVKTQNGGSFCITARIHAVTGYTIQDDNDIATMTNPGQKYSYIQEPINRLLMAIRRKGYTLIPEHVFCSQIPTSREQVNMVGAGIRHISVGDIFKARKNSDIEAKNILQSSNVLTFEEVMF